MICVLKFATNLQKNRNINKCFKIFLCGCNEFIAVSNLIIDFKQVFRECFIKDVIFFTLIRPADKISILNTEY